MNKNDICKRVYDVHGGMSYADTQKIVDLILEIIKRRISRGEKILLSGFGSFIVKKRKDKQGVNPQTGERIHILGKNAVKFKPSRHLKSI